VQNSSSFVFVYVFFLFKGVFMKKILKKALLLTAVTGLGAGSGFAAFSYAPKGGDSVFYRKHNGAISGGGVNSDLLFMGVIPKTEYNSVFQDKAVLQRLNPVAHYFREDSMILSSEKTLDLRNSVIEIVAGNAAVTASEKIMLHTLVKAYKLVIVNGLGEGCTVKARNNGDAFFVEGTLDFRGGDIDLAVTACCAECIEGTV
jgi:hypothetical protein